MSHFAKVENGTVTQVIVVEQDVLDTGLFGDPNLWVQSSYNTFGGQHLLGGTPLRKNYAGIGYLFREDINSPEGAFVPPCPGDEYILDETTGLWVIPS